MNYNITLVKLQSYYYENKQVKLSLYTIRKILRTHFDLNYKRLRITSEYVKTITFHSERFIFLKLLLNMIKKYFTIIFIDESCFNFYYEKRKLWYNNNLIYKKNSLEYGCSFNNQQLIISTTFDKIIYYENFEGTNNADTFNMFIDNMFEALNQKHPSIDLSKTYFFMDNSRVHDSEKTYVNFKNRNCKIFWGVNNYSNLDFCEYLFRPIKINHYKNIYKSGYF
jgi:hypothetical protein